MGIKFIRACGSYWEQLIRMTESTVGPHDPEELDAFAKKLWGVGGIDRGQLLAKMKGVKVPAGFHHVEFYNLTLDREWGGMYTDPCKPLDLHSIIVHLTVENDDIIDCPDLGVWHETVALPVKRRGVLELGLLYRPRRDTDGDNSWAISKEEWDQNV